MSRSPEGYTDVFVRLADELVAEIDKRRGKLNRAAYVRRVLERETGVESPTGHVRRRPANQESALADDLAHIASRRKADHKGQGESPRSQKEA
jgi:hypothetical protein